MQVDFYHLTGAPIDAVLPRIAERVLAGGARLLVVSADERQLAHLDIYLWAYAKDSFLPHGRADAGGAVCQPVLLSASCEAANAATNIAIVDGIWRDEALGFDRAFHFFDDEAIEAARGAWRALADKPDIERRYWKQDGARWSQVA